MDTIIQCAEGVLLDPIIGKPLLEYYKMVETDLCNHAITTVQCLDLELKIFEFLVAEHETALTSLNDCKAGNMIIADW